MDLSKYRGVQTVEMDRTDAFLPTLFMWDFTCQQCYPPYTKPHKATISGWDSGTSRHRNRNIFEANTGRKNIDLSWENQAEHQAERIVFLWLFHWGNPKILAHLQSIRPPQSIVVGRTGRTPRKLWGWKPESYPLLQDVLLPMTCLWVHGDLGFDQWDSEWCQADLPGFYNPTPLRLAGTLGPAAVWSFFLNLGVTGKETPGHVPSGND